jgi:hypothetical protein
MSNARFCALCALVVSAPKLHITATLILGAVFTGLWFAHEFFSGKPTATAQGE